jgi:hypothetical protein
MNKTIEIDDDLKIQKMSMKNKDGILMERLGNCKRCGKCCELYMGAPCKFLKYEYVDDIRLAMCELQWTKPMGCVLYPMVDEKIIEGCGFYWVEKKD